MKTVLTIVLFICLATSNLFAQSAISQDAVSGTWLVQDGSAKVKIEKINGKFSGKITWIKNPNDKNGKPLTDSKNPNTSLRNRPQLGLHLLENFVFDEENLWTSGTIYDPDEGKTYSCKITMTNAQTIEVRGYVGVSLFGRTETWKRSLDNTITEGKTE